LPAGGPVEELRGIGAAYVEFARKNPRLYRLMFGAELAGKLHLEGLGAARWRAQKVLQKTIAHCQEAGEIGPGEAREHAMSAWALMHGVATLVLDGQLALVLDERGTTEFPRRAADLLIDGLRGRKEER
jgi:AcrR family transcriptional regulator